MDPRLPIELSSQISAPIHGAMHRSEQATFVLSFLFNRTNLKVTKTVNTSKTPDKFCRDNNS